MEGEATAKQPVKEPGRLHVNKGILMWIPTTRKTTDSPKPTYRSPFPGTAEEKYLSVKNLGP